jgi:hypothetical protein
LETEAEKFEKIMELKDSELDRLTSELTKMKDSTKEIQQQKETLA